MHPTASVSVYLGPDEATSHATRAGGALVPVTPTLLVTDTMEVEEGLDVNKRAAVVMGEGVKVRLAIRLWPSSTTPAYRIGQLATLTLRGKAERLRVVEVIGPWSDGDPDDHVELLCVSRAGGDL